MNCFVCGKPDCPEPDPHNDPYSVPLCEECLEKWVDEDNYRMDTQQEEAEEQ